MPKSSSQGGSILEKFFIKGRHFGCYAWVTSQKYTLVNTVIRRNSPSYLIYRVNSKELETISKELSDIDIDKFKILYNRCVKKDRFGFLYIDVRSNKRYSCNFTHHISITEK